MRYTLTKMYILEIYYTLRTQTDDKFFCRQFTETLFFPIFFPSIIWVYIYVFVYLCECVLVADEPSNNEEGRYKMFSSFKRSD